MTRPVPCAWRYCWPGIDQWGLAWCQAFRLSAIPGVSELLGELRTGLDAAADARFQQAFAAIEAGEGNAVDFKMDLRRNIHLGLWHAMIACEERVPRLKPCSPPWAA
jgi:hypothetical protein